MTVRYLQSIHHKPQPLNDSTIVNKYKAGFGECAQQITRYVQKSDGMKQEMKQRLISYLSHCLQSLDSASSHFKPFTSSNIVMPKLLPKTEVKSSPFFDSLSKNVSPLNLTSNSLDINNNCQNIENDVTTPPSSANSSLFSFNFPPHLPSNNHHSNLISPHRPDTPTTPSLSQSSVSISISYPYSMLSSSQNLVKCQIENDSQIWRPW